VSFKFCKCRRDRAKAVEILVKDLKVFAAFNEELFKEITQLLTLENFRYFFLKNVNSYLCLIFVLMIFRYPVFVYFDLQR
jgi:hypothetical protein